MDRTIFWSQAQMRAFDLQNVTHDVLDGMAALTQDTFGQTTTVLAGLAATQQTPASLTINLAAGRIYQLADADATADGSIPQDLAQIMQQGFAAAQQVTLTTSGLTAGQSRWALVQAEFSQQDSIRSGDPNGGLLYFYNAANPSQPYQGPGNDGATTPTVRQGLCTISVVYGGVATTGSEVPPNPSAGCIGLYLIDLTYGQTQVTSSEILVAGPSVGTGVPSNYPQAPFLAGLLNSHHSGAPGQAPKINLATETQGTLPSGNLPTISGRLLGVQRFTANGTYTPTPGAVTAVVKGVGGGGAGGGASGSASTVYVGSGGWSGSYGSVRLPVSSISGASITIGSGGTGVSGANGGSGGSTTVGSVVTFPGGPGGNTSNSSTTVILAGVSGSASAVTTTSGVVEEWSCTPGSVGVGIYSGPALNGGTGGSSPFGPGAVYGSGLVSQNGPAAGANTGAGGCGAGSANGTTYAGGAAGSGYVEIREYS